MDIKCKVKTKDDDPPHLQEIEGVNGRLVQARHPGAVTVAGVGSVSVMPLSFVFEKLPICFWHSALGQEDVKEMVQHLAKAFRRYRTKEGKNAK